MSSWVVFHQKGGQGKTTMAVNLAHGFSLMGEKTSYIDICSQNHGSKYFGIKEPSNTDSLENGDHLYSLYDLVFPDPRYPVMLENIVIKNVRENLDLIQNRHYQDFSERLVEKRAKKAYLDALKKLDSEYDHVVYDTHPSRDNVNTMALQYAEYLVVPVELKTAAVESFQKLFEYLEEIEADNFKKIFILPNFLDKRKKDRKIYLNQITEMFKDDDDVIVLPVLPDKSDIEDLVKRGHTMFESDVKDVRELMMSVITKVVESLGEEI